MRDNETERFSILRGLPDEAPAEGHDTIVIRHFNEVHKAIERMDRRRPLLVDIASVDVDTAQRILDTLAGAAYISRIPLKKVREGLYSLNL